MTTLVTWSPQPGPLLNLKGAVWAVDKFVAVDWDGAVVTSTDGATWTTGTCPYGDWTSIAWSGSEFVAVSQFGGVAMTSPDGFVWTARTIANYPWMCVAWGGGVFAAVASTGQIATSTNGVTWTLRTSPVASLYEVIWGVDKFVAVGHDSAVSSLDGLTWTLRTIPSTQYESVAFGEGVFVACGFYGGTAYSHDGVSWYASSAATNRWVAGVVFAGTQFVAISQAWGWAGGCMVSDDGATWVLQEIDEMQWQAVVWNGAFLLAVGNDSLGVAAVATGTVAVPPFWRDFVLCHEGS